MRFRARRGLSHGSKTQGVGASLTNGEKVFAGVLIVAIVWIAADVAILAGVLPSFGGLLPGSAASDDGAGSGTDNSLAARILNAIQDAENVNPSHNNPGGICGSFDANGNCLGPKTYDTLADGTAAALALINRYLVVNPTITVSDFVNKWTGGATTGYLTKILMILHLEGSDPIAQAGAGGVDPGSESDSDDNPDYGGDDSGGEDDGD